jgi:predicted Rossmann fold flavoprotein
MQRGQIAITGGGAAGFFAAITCAEAAPGCEVVVLEKSSRFLAKVRISGGGRCNVTHSCFDPRELSRHYPRGGNALLGPFTRFQPSDTKAWFEQRGVRLKTESDGRMFPVTDSSETIVDCLVSSAQRAGVRLISRRGVEGVVPRLQGGFALELSGGERMECDRLLLATGGCRANEGGRLAAGLGHSLQPPVPSLFTFHVALPWLRSLAGVSVDPVELTVPGSRLRERGGLLITHEGLSGPVVLRLSAWGARVLHGMNYEFPLRINWFPELTAEALGELPQRCRSRHSARLVVNSPVAPLPARLWESLVLAADVPRRTRWAELSRSGRHGLVRQLGGTGMTVVGKSLNRDEFVTCGGVTLDEVNFKTMESRICPGLYFGGELLDIDGVTGGFNFQAAWTTGWIAGRAMAGA